MVCQSEINAFQMSDVGEGRIQQQTSLQQPHTQGQDRTGRTSSEASVSEQSPDGHRGSPDDPVEPHLPSLVRSQMIRKRTPLPQAEECIHPQVLS